MSVSNLNLRNEFNHEFIFYVRMIIILVQEILLKEILQQIPQNNNEFNQGFSQNSRNCEIGKNDNIAITGFTT